MKKFVLSVFFLLGGAGFSGAFADDPRDVYLTVQFQIFDENGNARGTMCILKIDKKS